MVAEREKIWWMNVCWLRRKYRWRLPEASLLRDEYLWLDVKFALRDGRCLQLDGRCLHGHRHGHCLGRLRGDGGSLLAEIAANDGDEDEAAESHDGNEDHNEKNEGERFIRGVARKCGGWCRRFWGRTRRRRGRRREHAHQAQARARLTVRVDLARATQLARWTVRPTAVHVSLRLAHDVVGTSDQGRHRSWNHRGTGRRPWGRMPRSLVIVADGIRGVIGRPWRRPRGRPRGRWERRRKHHRDAHRAHRVERGDVSNRRCGLELRRKTAGGHGRFHNR